MYAMRAQDRAELQAYRATGLSPAQVEALKAERDEYSAAPMPLIDESQPVDADWDEK
ncbi:MAG: hypothetical protein AB9880_00125 [Christensenellales bacterium]